MRWGFTVLSNFTVGMASAVFSFMWALPGLIGTYATSTLSAVFFFAVASLSAASVALSLLLLLYGTAGGAVYGIAKAAPAMARIEAQRRQQERVRLIEQHRRMYRGGGGGAGGGGRGGGGGEGAPPRFTAEDQSDANHQHCE